MIRHLSRAFVYASVGACLLGASVLSESSSLTVYQAAESAPPSPTSWLDELLNLPLFRFFSGTYQPDTHQLPADAFAGPPAPAPCSIEPLAQIEDPEAVTFEQGPTAVDRGGLTPGTARALARFERLVTSRGGVITITSAFRPSPYQEHLQQVWDKWINELRNNVEEGCQTLRAEVGQEFARHQLLERQRPVPFSDHTKGIGFDAAVMLPVYKVRRKRVSTDALARLSGLRRPDIFRDPVHYRFIGRT